MSQGLNRNNAKVSLDILELNEKYNKSNKRLDSLISNAETYLSFLLENAFDINEKFRVSRQKITSIRSNLNSCKSHLICKRNDLKKLWNDQLEQTEMANYIELLANVKDAPGSAMKLIEEEKYVSACRTLVEAGQHLDLELSSLTSLNPLKTEISSLQLRTFDKIVTHINRIVYHVCPPPHVVDPSVVVGLVQNVSSKTEPDFVVLGSLLFAANLLGRLPDLLYELRTRIVQNLYEIGERITNTVLEEKNPLYSFFECLSADFSSVGHSHGFIVAFLRQILSTESEISLYDSPFVWEQIAKVLQEVVMMYLRPDKALFSSLESTIDETSFFHKNRRMDLSRDHKVDKSSDRLKLVCKPQAGNVIVVLEVLGKYFVGDFQFCEKILSSFIEDVFIKSFYEELMAQVVSYSQDISILSVLVDKRTQKEQRVPKYLLQSHVRCFTNIIEKVEDCSRHLDAHVDKLADLLLELLLLFQQNCQICVKKLSLMEDCWDSSSVQSSKTCDLFGNLNTQELDSMLKSDHVIHFNSKISRFIASMYFSSKWLLGKIKLFFSNVEKNLESTTMAKFETLVSQETSFGLHCCEIVRYQLRVWVVGPIAALVKQSCYDCTGEDSAVDINVLNLSESILSVHDEFEQLLSDSAHLRRFFEDLDDVVSYLMMKGSIYMVRINSNGVKKMMRNILALQQLFFNVLGTHSEGLDKCRDYFSLLEMSEEDILSSVMQNGGSFPYSFYRNISDFMVRSNLTKLDTTKRKEFLKKLKSMLTG